MPSEEKLKWERELLGLYLSDHPLNRYKETIAKITKLTLSDVTDAMMNKTVRVGGIIGDIKKILTKTGRPMLVAKLEDLNGTLEITVFPNTLEKTLTIWQKDNIIVVEGRVNQSFNGLKIICEKVKTIQQIYEKTTQQNKPD
jgi:DNA polymerase-3 subunit alpha